MNIFNVNLERFSGPYSKILELIETSKLSINELSLAKITDEYILFIKSLETQNKIDISEFILVASTLMLIKAKSLFPDIVYTEEEKETVSILEEKLKLYQIMLKASKNISKIFYKQRFYSLAEQKNPESVFVFDQRLDQSFLHIIALATILKFPKLEKLKTVSVQQILKIEDVIEKLLTRINLANNFSFQDFSNSLGQTFKTFSEKKNAFIISFLAILELVKSGSIQATQNHQHNEIEISKT